MQPVASPPEVHQKEFVNKPLVNFRNVKVQQSMKNFFNRTRRIAPGMPKVYQEVIENPYFVNMRSKNQIGSNDTTAETMTELCPEIPNASDRANDTDSSI